jgi:hypothetical protein
MINTFAKVLDDNFGGCILWLPRLVHTIYGLDFAVLYANFKIGEGIDDNFIFPFLTSIFLTVQNIIHNVHQGGYQPPFVIYKNSERMISQWVVAR